MVVLKHAIDVELPDEWDTSIETVNIDDYLFHKYSGVSSMELRELEHPPQFWHNSQLSSSLTTIFTDNRKLAATTND